jgi:hypothetical protein
MDLGALPLLFSDEFIPFLIFCCHNPGRRCIFPGTLKISQKNSFLPILAPDEILMNKTDIGVLRTFFVGNKNYKLFLYLKNSGRKYILK